MKKIFSTLLLFSLSILTSAQTSKEVKEIFYNLPLDASRKEISVKLNADSRFRSTDQFLESKLFFSKPGFIGICSDLGLIKSKPDSLEVELTWGYSYSPESKKKNKKISENLYFKSRYYYASPDSAEKEYQNMLVLLRKLTHDTLLTGIDTIFSDSPVRSQLKTHGVDFIFRKPYYKVQVAYANITKNYFGVFLEYSRKEK